MSRRHRDILDRLARFGHKRKPHRQLSPATLSRRKYAREYARSRRGRAMAKLQDVACAAFVVALVLAILTLLGAIDG